MRLGWDPDGRTNALKPGWVERRRDAAHAKLNCCRSALDFYFLHDRHPSSQLCLWCCDTIDSSPPHPTSTRLLPVIRATANILLGRCATSCRRYKTAALTKCSYCTSSAEYKVDSFIRFITRKILLLLTSSLYYQQQILIMVHRL